MMLAILFSLAGHTMNRKADTLFVILFEGRTGSSFLVSLLNDHTEVLCYPEILVDSSEQEQSQIFSALKAGEPVEELRNFASSGQYFNTEISSKTNLRAVGFKSKLMHIDSLSYFEDFMWETNGRVIYLTRKNLIKSTLSVMNSRLLYEEHQQWNALSSDQTVGKTIVDIEEFKDILRRREKGSRRYRKYFRSLTLPKIKVFYEDLLNDKDAFMNRIFDFLGVGYQETQGTFEKNTSDDLHEAIENYDELYAAFADTEYEQYFQMD